MKFEIVSHCWNYARLLTYQLSSFVLHPPGSEHELRATVYFATCDQRTVDTLAFFSSIDKPTNVLWDFRAIEPSRLCKRAIGRNEAALATEADWVWFADCDMPIGDGAWDAIAKHAESVKQNLMYPRTVNVSVSHESGDKLIEAVTEPAIIEVSRRDFGRRKYNRAIGGVQITRGDRAREIGYLPQSRRAQMPSRNWRRTYEDKTYRRALGTRGAPVNLPNVFRIRHSKRGRDHVGVEL